MINKDQNGHWHVGIADRTVIISTIIGISVAVFLVEGIYNLADTLIGLALLATLHACDSKEDKTRYQSASFALAWALSFILVIGFIVINPYIMAPQATNTGVPPVKYFDPFTSIEVPASKFIINTLKDQASDTVTFLIALATAFLVYVRRRRMVRTNSLSSPTTPKQDTVLSRPSGQVHEITASNQPELSAPNATPSMPSFKEMSIVLALLNVLVIISYLWAEVASRRKRRS